MLKVDLRQHVTQPQIKGHTIEAWGILIYHNAQAHFPHGLQSRHLDRI